MKPFSHSSVRRLIGLALKEDISTGDVTTRALFTASQRSRAEILSHGNGILAGGPLLAVIYLKLGNVTVRLLKKEGSRIRPGERIALFEGSTRSILTGERVAINFLGRLTGVATLTHRYATILRGCQPRIFDTRKTTPGHRLLEKYAVRVGGGVNHRNDLSSHILIKDNHIAASTLSISAMVRKTLASGHRPVEIEVKSLDELREALSAKPDILLLDNMPTPLLRKAIAVIRKSNTHPEIEISGGVNEPSLRRLRKLNVDRISSGAITHSAPSVDFSLEILTRL